MNKIKAFIFRFFQRRQPARRASFPHYDQVRSVLVIFESDLLEDNRVVTETIRKKLLADDKDVVLLGYAPKKEIQSPILPQSRIMGLKDHNLLDIPRSELVESLQRRQYDMLIDLTQTPILPLQYMTMYARADFKTGMQRENGLLDFMIQTEPQDSPLFLFDQIIYFLKHIQSND
ncbi:MAG: hypothetical protein II144_04275 [Paludibacteraceae bacterium]|nr:hypothetical protein [Paludibacteraceae bacterium]MBQ2607939.1 hypothetical protein [Paludibacteraceae bacterium]